MLPFRLLRPGQRLPDWVPFSIDFSRQDDGQSIRVGCWCIAWRNGGRVSLRPVFGGTLIEVESAGAEAAYVLRDDAAYLYPSPFLPVMHGCSIAYKRRGRVVRVVGHSADLKSLS